MWRASALVLALLLAASLSACAGGGGSSGKPVVVASFYPLEFVAERVTGRHAEIVELARPGVEPHDLELRPRQVADVARADVAFYEKGLQPSVDAAIEQDPPDQVVDAASVIDLQQVDGDVDPHFWLDPTLLARAADAFTSAMVEADPAHAEDYRRNLAGLEKELEELDGAYRTGLEQCRARTVVVAHDAFGYLGRRYRLDVQAIAGISPDAEPSAARLAELSDLASREGVTTVFTETLVSPQIAEAVADDAGLRTAVLDPLEGLTSEDQQADYLSLMRDNLTALRDAGGCT